MFKKLFTLWALCILSVISPAVTHAALPSGFQKSTVASGLNYPDALAESPDGRIFILQKGGLVKVYKGGSLLSSPALSLAVDKDGEHGLLGIAFDPGFSGNHYVYLSYVNKTPNELRVSRFVINGDTIDASSEKVLIKSTQPLNTYHIAGTVRFGPDGKLWISVGNNANNANSQDLTNIHGKILRINPDGSIPTDNPFYGLTGDQASIWAYGFRNPFRFNFLPDGRPIVGDVGEANSEEIDVIEKGGNYGWPGCEGFCTSPNAQYVSPLFSYSHGGGSAAVAGGYVNTGSQFGTSYNNTYFYGDYAKGFVRYLKLGSGGNFLSDNDFDSGAGPVVDLMGGQDGSLYFVTIADRTFGPNTGAIYKISYNSSNAQPSAKITATPNAGLAPLSVSFSSDGSSDPSGGNLTYSWDFGDGASSTDPNPTHVYTANGAYDAKLTVKNASLSNTASTKITVGKELPVPTILTPLANAKYNAGDTISFSADATDAQDGTLPDSAFSWSILFHHQTHIHPFMDSLKGVKSGTFVIPNTGEPSAETSYEIVLTVTDSAGLSKTINRSIKPNVVNLDFATFPVTGLTIMVDGIPHSAPYRVASVVGFKHGLDAPVLQTLNGFNYTFSKWSDDLAQSHLITTATTDTTYLAGFNEAVSGSGQIHFRVREIDKNSVADGKFINGATAVLTDTTGEVAFQTTTSKVVNGEDGWVFFDNVPSGQYGTLTYKSGTTGVWKQTTCEGAGTTQNASLKNKNTNNFIAAWQNSLTVVANKTTWCADEGLQAITTGSLALRISLIEPDPNVPGAFIANTQINDATVKLTDTSGNTTIQTKISKVVNGQDGWAFFDNVPSGTYGLMSYKSGLIGFRKMTSCAGAYDDVNASIQNVTSENNKAAWNNNVNIVAGVTNYCYDLGFQGSGAVHYRVREYNSEGTWTGKYVNGATAKLTDTTGATVIQTATSKVVNGEDGWVFFDNVKIGSYGAMTYKVGSTGVWKQTDCGTGGTTTDATIQNVNTESTTAAWQSNLNISGEILWCSDIGIGPKPTAQAGGIHFRVREIDASGNSNGNFINGATAKLTDTTGATVIQTATSKVVNGEDGWVFFDQVPVGTYGLLTYKQDMQGGWKQTDCGTGGTTTDATIQNVNTENNLAAWQAQITITANQITWCSDEGLKTVQSMTASQTATATAKPASKPIINPTSPIRPTTIPTATTTPTPLVTQMPTATTAPISPTGPASSF